jgi:ABC-2 type transport system ATP-binding protein
VDSLLEFSGVSKTFDRFALRDVSFVVPPGYIVGLIGPNGAGKSTLMRLALGLIHSDAGAVRVFGQDPGTVGASVRARMGFVHEEPAFHDYLSAGRVASMVAPFYPTWDAERCSSLLTDFCVPPRVPIRSLSRGTRMKCALALALSHRAELLLLDEPTSGLDPVFRDQLLDHLSSTIGDGRTSVVFSTQIMADLERIADFVVLVREGRVQYAGPKDDILDHWAVVRAGREMHDELNGLSPRGLRVVAGRVDALVEDLADAHRRFDGRAVVERATLDDVFLLCGELPRKELS